jgi:hypothetical protein
MSALPNASHPLWLTWVGIIQRCTKPGSPGYENYKDKGVCDRWLASFAAFLEDVGECPSEEHTLDRIRNEVGYQPDNVRWATKHEQAMNKGNTIRVISNGKLVPLWDLALKHGVNPETAYSRWRKQWPLKKVLERDPTAFKGRVSDIEGKTFGRLTALKVVRTDGHSAFWECRCSCGAVVVKKAGALKSGNTRSCGCLLSEYHANMKENAPHKSHGMSKTPTFVSWVVMRRNHAESVCSEWASFEKFLEDMGEKPKNTRLIRANKKQKFSKANCSWG